MHLLLLGAILMQATYSAEFTQQQHEEGQLCTVDTPGTADDGGLVVEDNGKFRLSRGLGIRSADNEMLVLVAAGAELPARGYAVLTTSRLNQSALHVDLLYGDRFSANGNILVGALSLSGIGEAPRGWPQFSVRLDARAGRIRVQLKTMHAPSSGSGSKSSVFVMDDVDVSAGAVGTHSKENTNLPSKWRFENPYSDLPHPGFAVNHRFLELQQRDPKAASAVIPQDRGDVLPSFTASKVWPAAYAMVAYLEQLEQAEGSVGGKSVLELGAGTGLVGLAAAMLGATRVVLTDLDENLGLLEHNAKQNGLSGNTQAAGLDWTADIPLSLQGPWDIIVAADCVFWEYLFEPLVSTLAQLLKPDTLVLISVTHRFGRTPGFLAQLGDHCKYEKIDVKGVRMANTDIYRVSVMKKQHQGSTNE